MGKKFNIYILIISLIYILISFYLIIALYKIKASVINSFPEYSYAFKSEASAVSSPVMSYSYLEITLPFMIMYFLSYIILFWKSYLKSISMPLTFFVLVEYLFYYKFLSIGAMYAWTTFFYFPIVIIGLAGAISGGVLLDIFLLKRLKEKKQEVYQNNEVYPEG